MAVRERQLSLVKGRHRYVFNYPVGFEPELIGSLIELADDPDSEFDWLDAAVVCYEMGRRVEADEDPAWEAMSLDTDD